MLGDHQAKLNILPLEQENCAAALRAWWIGLIP